MKKTGLFLISIWAYCIAAAQVDFKTLVPDQPVVAGQPFTIQYVMEDVDKEAEFLQPEFKGLQLINGPGINIGTVYGPDGPRRIRNIVYTLLASRPGKYIVPGGTVKINGKQLHSENAVVQVLSKADAFNMGLQVAPAAVNQDYFLAPGEEPYSKIRRNLFIKVSVDKKTCYVGEPVTAIFKLYSRLESRSDIVKNPGFYGFTVQDMVGLGDKLTSTETINGKRFDVHMVRKVQLYPLQAGSFTVDPMEVANKVEFSRSAVNRRTEQEIQEGVFSDNDMPMRMNTQVFASNMSTEPVKVLVKPLPSVNQPASFNGATGRFSIQSTVEKNELSKNEEGTLTITIKGKGNFTQLDAPAIAWPQGLEGFEPTVKDSLNNTKAPIEGSRVFRFRFVSSKAGTYLLPGIRFSFFDPDSNSYKTVATRDTSIVIGKSEKTGEAVSQEATITIGKSHALLYWILGTALLGGMIYLFFRFRRTLIKASKKEPIVQRVPVLSPSEILEKAYEARYSDDKKFYSVLRSCIWFYLSDRFGLSGSQMNKYSLVQAMQEKEIPENLQQQVLDVLSICETGIFTGADTIGDKLSLLERTKSTLKMIGNEQA